MHRERGYDVKGVAKGYAKILLLVCYNAAVLWHAFLHLAGAGVMT
jgi:hypothetical protein